MSSNSTKYTDPDYENTRIQTSEFMLMRVFDVFMLNAVLHGPHYGSRPSVCPSLTGS